VELGADNHYSTHLFTAETEKVINAHDSSEPLFLYLAYQAVHGPTEAPDSYVTPYLHIKDERRRVYAGMLAALDEGVGNVTAALKAKGMWDRTLLVFTTDNGGPSDMCMIQGSKNSPLRGGKCSITEGGVRGNAFVGGGGGALPAEVRGLAFRDLMHAVDLLPTLAAAAGARPDTNFALDGVNQLEALRSANARAMREDVFIGFDGSDRKGCAVRTARWKLLRGATSMGVKFPFFVNNITTRNYTLLSAALDVSILQLAFEGYGEPEELSWPWDPQKPPERLFDMIYDQEENNDVAKDHPEIVEELRSRLDHYVSQASAAGTDPALSPQCCKDPSQALKKCTPASPPKHSNRDGPSGEPAKTPWCDLGVTEVLV